MNYLFFLIFGVFSLNLYAQNFADNDLGKVITEKLKENIEKERIRKLSDKEKVKAKATKGENKNKEEYKDYENMTELLLELFSQPDFKDTKVSFSLISNGKVLISVNKDLKLNQASVSKLVVTLAALKYLGLNYRFKTDFYINEKIDKDGVLNGDLIIKGYGDPNLLSEDIYKIIDVLKLTGLREIKGNVIVDLSYFDKKYSIYELKEEDDSRAYAAFNNALPLNYNSFKFSLRPYLDTEKKENDKVKVYVSYPSSLVVRIKNNLVLSRRYSKVKAITKEHKYHNTMLELTGRVNKKTDLLVFYRKIQYPDYYFGKIFYKMLKYSGIKVKGRLKIKYEDFLKDKNDIRLLFAYKTKYLLDTLIIMNRYSNNFIAEQLLKIIGAEYLKTNDLQKKGSWEAGIKAVKEMLEKDVGLTGDYVYTNGSGLNDANFFSSYQIATLLDYIKNNFDYKWYMLSTLPKIGISGTLRRYCLSEECKGKVVAKTGSLRSTVALAGYIKAQKNVYSFALAVNFKRSKKKFRKILNLAKRLMTDMTELFDKKEIF